jgi:hypothetical protein
MQGFTLILAIAAVLTLLIVLEALVGDIREGKPARGGA